MKDHTPDLSALRIETPPLTLRALALERLRRAIISGVFEPGQRLVERTLGEQLGVSRSVIREVVRHRQARVDGHRDGLAGLGGGAAEDRQQDVTGEEVTVGGDRAHPVGVTVVGDTQVRV